MSRRILYVIDGLNVGGAEMLLLRLVDAALDRGDRVHVAYFSSGPLRDQIASRGVSLTRLGRLGLLNPFVLLRLLSLMGAWRPDVIHTHLVKSDLIGQIAARMMRTPRVLTLHNTNPWRRNRLLSLIYRAATSGGAACIAVSDEVADYVARLGGYLRNRIEVIPNGVDLDRFDPMRTRPLGLAMYGVPASAVTVAVIGRLSPQKDHATFLHAAAALAARDPRIHFLIVGAGPLRDQIASKAKQLGLLEGRLTLTGIVSEMPAFLAAIDILVLSSKWEGLPMTMLEAMAMGRPIVSTSVGGVPDVIRHGENGVLVPPSDPAALAEAIGRLVADAGERRRIGEAGRSTVRERFDAGLMLNRLWAVYDRGELGPAGSERSLHGRAPAKVARHERSREV